MPTLGDLLFLPVHQMVMYETSSNDIGVRFRMDGFTSLQREGSFRFRENAHARSDRFTLTLPRVVYREARNADGFHCLMRQVEISSV